MSVFGRDVDIIVRAGPVIIETRRCRIINMADGRNGAVWRGLVYPVHDGNYIDADGEAVPPNARLDGIKPSSSSTDFASIQGDDEAYLLVAGPVTARDEAAARLRAAGVTVLRAGRYLGDTVDGFSADWFVRIERPRSDESLDELLGRVLGRRRAQTVIDPETASETRIRLLQDEIATARGRETALRKELAEERAAASPAKGSAATDALLSDLAEERRLREAAEVARATAEAALEAARAELELTRATPTALRQAPSRTRLHDEISDVLASLLPNLNLLRDSLTVAASEYTSRKPLYRCLAELASAAGRLPPNWKSVQSVAGWWERHVSDGQANTGRIYALYVQETQCWDVLISDKAEQSRDMAWLRKYTPSGC